MNYTQKHLGEAAAILERLDVAAIEKIAETVVGDKGVRRPTILPGCGRKRRQLFACSE